MFWHSAYNYILCAVRDCWAELPVGDNTYGYFHWVPNLYIVDVTTKQ